MQRQSVGHHETSPKKEFVQRHKQTSSKEEFIQWQSISYKQTNPEEEFVQRQSIALKQTNPKDEFVQRQSVGRKQTDPKKEFMYWEYEASPKKQLFLRKRKRNKAGKVELWLKGNFLP